MKNVVVAALIIGFFLTACNNSGETGIREKKSIITITDTNTPIPINSLSPSPTLTIIENIYNVYPMPTRVGCNVESKEFLKKLDLLISKVSIEKQQKFEEQYKKAKKEFIMPKGMDEEIVAFIELLNTDIEYRYLLFNELFNNMIGHNKLCSTAIIMMKAVLMYKADIPEVKRFLDASTSEILVDNELIQAILEDPDKYLEIDMTEYNKEPYPVRGLEHYSIFP